ncbi:MAG: SCP2 sterol-binding domain-containing protein, partial [Deltaproteobacteria bacterium]
IEGWLPRAFREAELPESARNLAVKLGVKLDGEGGGEWVFHLDNGELRVESGPREAAAFTLIQTVSDWRGALFEGRGGAFGKQASALFRPGSQPEPGGALGRNPGNPAAVAALQNLDGLIRMVVSGGERGDWSIGFKLGPGAIPDQPTTTVTVSAEVADRLERGELDPLQAFMSGQIQIAGDMALMMQMQMALQAPLPPAGS